jgi:hypothetical protein
MAKPRTAKARVKNYVEISPEAHELKLRLLTELGISANRLSELALQALAADVEAHCGREVLERKLFPKWIVPICPKQENK